MKPSPAQHQKHLSGGCTVDMPPLNCQGHGAHCFTAHYLVERIFVRNISVQLLALRPLGGSICWWPSSNRQQPSCLWSQCVAAQRVLGPTPRESLCQVCAYVSGCGFWQYWHNQRGWGKGATPESVTDIYECFQNVRELVFSYIITLLYSGLHVLLHYYNYNCFMALGILSGTTRMSQYQKGKTRKVKSIWIYWSKWQWVAMTSAGLYTNLHLTLDR